VRVGDLHAEERLLPTDVADGGHGPTRVADDCVSPARLRMPPPLSPFPTCQPLPEGVNYLHTAREGIEMDEGDPVLDPSLSAFEKAALGKDSYVFYKETSDKVGPFDPIQNPEYRFLADLEACTDGWRWTAFAIIEVDDMLQLSEVANRIIAPPDPVDETAKPVKYGARVMRRTKHYKYFGFARLHVQRRRVDEVLLAINEATTPGYSGSAAVTGAFQIIVELGSDEGPDEVCQRLQALGDVPGVTNVEGARVTGSQYYYKGLKREVGVAEED
jgi:hypothetical protein